jgi:hypothetical protein
MLRKLLITRPRHFADFAVGSDFSTVCTRTGQKRKLLPPSTSLLGACQPPTRLIIAAIRHYKQTKQIGKITANAEGCWSIQCQRFMLRALRQASPRKDPL